MTVAVSELYPGIITLLGGGAKARSVLWTAISCFSSPSVAQQAPRFTENGDIRVAAWTIALVMIIHCA